MAVLVAVDAAVRTADPNASREPRLAAEERDRHISVTTLPDGMARLSGTVASVAAAAFDHRLSEMATAVCAADPCTIVQRRAPTRWPHRPKAGRRRAPVSDPSVLRTPIRRSSQSGHEWSSWNLKWLCRVQQKNKLTDFATPSQQARPRLVLILWHQSAAQATRTHEEQS